MMGFACQTWLIPPVVSVVSEAVAFYLVLDYNLIWVLAAFLMNSANMSIWIF